MKSLRASWLPAAWNRRLANDAETAGNFPPLFGRRRRGKIDAPAGRWTGQPRLRPPFPAVEGLYASPTVINNVETLMNEPVIRRMGGAKYAEIGTETSTSTKVVSVSGNVKRPGNYEIDLGIPSRELIYGLAGGPPDGRTIKAWFPGGSSAPGLPGKD